MVPTPVEGRPHEYQYNFWDVITELPNELVEVTCLLPNSITILLKVHSNATLQEIKEDLWDEATNYPLYGKLHDMSVYVFTHINSTAELEVLNDETRRLCDIKPSGAVLIISECRTNSIDHSINIQIGHLIGKRLQEFDALNSPEINDFRFKMRKLGDELAEERTKLTWQEKLQYQFPARLNPGNYVMSDVLNAGRHINIASKFEHATDKNSSTTNEKDVMHSSFTFNVSPDIRPAKLLEMIVYKRATTLNIKNERPTDYVLKICGQDEFLVGDHPIIEFQYIQDCISKEMTPILVTIHKDRVPVFISNDYECLEVYDKKNKTNFSTLTLRKKGKNKSSWFVDDKFSITLNTISKLNCDPKKTSEIGIQAGLFHGGKALCQPVQTPDKQLLTDCNECQLDTKLEFDIKVCNIPRNAKLCFVLYEISRYAKGAKSKKLKEMAKDAASVATNPIAWANTTVYDFKCQLRSGAMTLYMWTYAEDMMSDDVLHPLGTVVSNPNTEYSTSLTLNFSSYADQTILYPCVESLINFTKDQNKITENQAVNDVDVENCLKVFQMMDNMYEIHDQDRKNIWQLRYYWLNHQPEILPKLLYCIDYDKKEDVGAVADILRGWPKLPAEKCLELLDYAYADQEVRSFAVKCLRNLSDEDLLLYLLQLVQAIKHELYLECDLVNFLMQRALRNQKIGHYLFWHLRSEMQVPAVSVRFGLILEGYCRGSQEHMPILLKQLDYLDKLKKCSEVVRQRRDKEKARAALKEYLSEDNNSIDCIKNIRSPLDPSYRCSKIRLERCRVMDSKMRPLWIVFENSDIYGDDVYMMFKNGDDLRQDMLTLQMLRIMDRLWKREGLDLRMNPYNCISTEYRVGMIEVVLNAETIANIQKEKGMFSATCAFRKTPILAWLKDYNTTEAALYKAVNEFTLSCAGYCVATYVLGIADRHSDNIMVKKSGQLFHIDFGHILGHFKEKFGFKRERVPFVLTHDFVYVINRGQKNSLEFKIFQEYCEKAFMILRKHGNLILSLCAMMISTGLPELSSEKDLNYLRETLVLSKTDEEALTHFRCKFDEALSNSWKTSLNWASHNIAKNNKQ